MSAMLNRVSSLTLPASGLSVSSAHVISRRIEVLKDTLWTVPRYSVAWLILQRPWGVLSNRQVYWRVSLPTYFST